MTYDHWKTTNPADEFLGPEPDEDTQPSNVNKCPACGRMFVDGETCTRGGCPMGGDF